ncbi:hypothetical protein LZC95_00080 [Pendulispora brunnea]|uniref:Uncharacterized protein n=1 Tax=Pendulispora brunnea TaxID=2905690 RepID=A0ABZ2K968_9BACT
MTKKEMMRIWGVGLLGGLFGCVPPGNSTPSDAGSTSAVSPTPSARPPRPAAANVLTSTFEDNFERTVLKPTATVSDAGGAGQSEAGRNDAASSASSDLGPNWRQANTDVWHIENGKLCGQGARNHGVWMTRAIPVNARIEFDALSDSPDGDLKAEVWGDGQSSATAISYTNATSYLTIFGGWKNKFHALARINEHGNDRKEVKVDKTSDDPREKPVFAGQIYHFKIERTDGKTVRWFVDNLEMASFPDESPLAGPGHEYFGFNDWEAKVCFDNVKVTPL